jgi:MoaA/NifB/PqqE/SkfB family radical SAM enzyme
MKNEQMNKKNTEQCGRGQFSRIVQVHLTLHCNLACKHCYSSSLPAYRAGLNLAELKRFLEYAFDRGYEVASFSGGEPFLYRDLSELLQFTRKIGFRNSVVSNGMLLNSERSREILDHIDLLAISIDGKPDLHNKIRGQDGAFEKTMDGIETLKQKNISFGFIHTVTSESWDSLLWLGELAQSKGAKLLQLHPLEMCGRAVDEMQPYFLDQLALHKVYLLFMYLRSKYEPELQIQLDLLHKVYIEEFPQTVSFFGDSAANKTFSEVLDTIVVDEKGNVLPVGYGFSDKFRIGAIADANNGNDMFKDFMLTKIHDLLALFDRAYKRIVNDSENDLVNWNELIIEMSNN